MGRSNIKSRQDAHDDETGSIGTRRMTTGEHLSGTDWWRVTSNQSMRDPVTTLFAAMPPLEAKKALFAFVAGVREKRRTQGHEEVKLMFVDVKRAHLKAKCEEEEWVEVPNEIKNFGRYAKLKRSFTG